MKPRSNFRGHGLVLLALTVSSLGAAGQRSAPSTTDYRAAIQKLADAIQKNESGQVKQLAEELAKAGPLLEVMNTLEKRDPAGKKLVFGVGKKPGGITPDGIEAKIQSLRRKPQPQKLIDRESGALVEMAYRVAAIGEVARLAAPERDQGMKKVKDWLEWSDAMRKSAEELADAAKAKNPTAVKNAAAKLDSSCTNCHGVFRE
jgi:Cytochrome C'